MPETGNVVCVEDFFATIESYLNKEQVEFVPAPPFRSVQIPAA